MDLSANDEILVFVLAAIGTFFMVVSGIGMIRLPDALTRMHAAGKAATLGVSSVLLAAGVFFLEDGRMPTMIALIVLFFVTAPVATTAMARAAYRDKGIKKELNPHLHYDEMAQSTPPQPTNATPTTEQPTHDVVS